MSAKTTQPAQHVEPALFDLPTQAKRPRPTRQPVNQEVTTILARLRATASEEDRFVVVRAVVLDARANNGRVDPNRVRARLVDAGGRLTVRPQLVGAIYQALTKVGVLVFDDWTPSTDRRGHNVGKPIRTYRLTRTPAAADAAA